ncbi:MAG TPA: hypothetical protein ENH29_02090, partial [Bacteroidetes bacterium]|nr:hypothetical protein [Bacteroidota bacterium]
MKCFSFVVLGLICSGSLAAADSYPKNPNIDILNYTFRIALNDSTNEIVAVTTVKIRFLTGGAPNFSLDFVDKKPELNWEFSPPAVTSRKSKRFRLTKPDTNSFFRCRIFL